MADIIFIIITFLYTTHKAEVMNDAPEEWLNTSP